MGMALRSRKLKDTAEAEGKGKGKGKKKASPRSPTSPASRRRKSSEPKSPTPAPKRGRGRPKEGTAAGASTSKVITVATNRTTAPPAITAPITPSPRFIGHSPVRHTRTPSTQLQQDLVDSTRREQQQRRGTPSQQLDEELKESTPLAGRPDLQGRPRISTPNGTRVGGAPPRSPTPVRDPTPSGGRGGTAPQRRSSSAHGPPSSPLSPGDQGGRGLRTVREPKRSSLSAADRAVLDAQGLPDYEPSPPRRNPTGPRVGGIRFSMGDLEEIRDDLQKQLEYERDESTKVSRALNDCEEHREDLEADLEEARENEDKLKQEVAELKKRLANNDRDRMMDDSELLNDDEDDSQPEDDEEDEGVVPLPKYESIRMQLEKCRDHGEWLQADFKKATDRNKELEQQVAQLQKRLAESDPRKNEDSGFLPDADYNAQPGEDNEPIDVSEYETRIAELEEELKEAREQNDLAQAIIEDKEQEMDDAQEELEDLRKDLDDALADDKDPDAMEEDQEGNAKLAQDLANCDEEREEQKKEIEKLKAKISKLELEIGDLQYDKQNIAAERDDLRKGRDDPNQQVQDLQDENIGYKIELNRLNEELRLARSGEIADGAGDSGDAEKIQELEAEVEKLKMDLAVALSQVGDTPEERRAQYEYALDRLQSDLAEQVALVSELQNQLEGLDGPPVGFRDALTQTSRHSSPRRSLSRERDQSSHGVRKQKPRLSGDDEVYNDILRDLNEAKDDAERAKKDRNLAQAKAEYLEKSLRECEEHRNSGGEEHPDISKQQAETFKEKNKDLKESNKGLKKLIEELSEANDGLKQEVDNLKKANAKLNQRLDDCLKHRDEKQGSGSAQDKEQVGILQDRVKELERQRDTYKKDLENCQKGHGKGKCKAGPNDSEELREKLAKAESENLGLLQAIEDAMNKKGSPGKSKSGGDSAKLASVQKENAELKKRLAKAKGYDEDDKRDAIGKEIRALKDAYEDSERQREELEKRLKKCEDHRKQLEGGNEKLQGDQTDDNDGSGGRGGRGGFGSGPRGGGFTHGGPATRGFGGGEDDGFGGSDHFRGHGRGRGRGQDDGSAGGFRQGDVRQSGLTQGAFGQGHGRGGPATGPAPTNGVGRGGRGTGDPPTGPAPLNGLGRDRGKGGPPTGPTSPNGLSRSGPAPAGAPTRPSGGGVQRSSGSGQAAKGNGGAKLNSGRNEKAKEEGDKTSHISISDYASSELPEDELNGEGQGSAGQKRKLDEEEDIEGQDDVPPLPERSPSWATRRTARATSQGAEHVRQNYKEQSLSPQSPKKKQKKGKK